MLCWNSTRNLAATECSLLCPRALAASIPARAFHPDEGWRVNAHELARSDSVVDLTGDVEDTPGGPEVLPPRQLALQYGRTPQTTTGEGDCLYHAVAAEATRVDIDLPPKSARNEATRADFVPKRARKRNMANGFWRPVASDCARQDFVQSLMNDGRDEEWRSGRSQTPRDPASYPDYIRAPSVWGSTFDVARAKLDSAC